VESNQNHWDHVAALCQEIMVRLPQVVPEAVRRIRAVRPDYRAIDEAGHESSVRGQYLGLMAGIAQRRGPNADEIELARNLGARRATQGLALESVVTSFHIACQQLWEILIEYAQRAGQSTNLLGVIDLVWSWIQAITSAAAEGHSAAVQSEQAQRLDTGYRFVEALYTGQSQRDTTVLLARSLGFDPAGQFCAACLVAGPDPDNKVDRLRRACRHLGAVTHTETRGATVIVIVQGANPHDAIRSADLDCTTGGVGLTRRGLDGLELSIREAERAMALAAHRASGVVDFGMEWWASALFPERLALAPILRPRTGTVAAHIVDAVWAYAAHGFSVAAAGQALHIHPNTVKYRLERWHQLTGWDPRTFDGLIKSTCSLALSPWDNEPGSATPPD
jgi:PucR C-terminal helix-turn-helix domain/GGDEF-like domain